MRHNMPLYREFRNIMKLDTLDLKILRELQDDGKITNAALAQRVNLSPSPCLTRVKRLEDAGLIRDYVALLDPAQLGLNLNVFIFISLKAQNRSFLSHFEDRICAHASAQQQGCRYLLTDNLPHAQRFETVEVLDPFRVGPDQLPTQDEA